MKTKVAVVLQGQLKGGVTLGKQQLRCLNIKDMTEAIGVVDVDSDANVELEFPRGQESPVKLRGLLDTGAGLSLMSLNAWKRISTQNRYPIKNLPIQLVAANGLEVRTYGIVEEVELILAGYKLKANFILIDAVDDQDFILGRTFMKKYDILVDLRKWKLTIRDPYMENFEEPVLQVGTEPSVDVLVADYEMLKTEQTSLIKVKLRTDSCLKNRLMLLTQKDELLTDRLFIGDSVVRVGDDNFCWCSVTNKDSRKKLSLKKNLAIATATLVMEENLIPETLIHPVVKTDIKSNEIKDSESEFIDSSTEFLSGSDCPLDDFSEFEREQQLDQALLKPIPKPDLSDVKVNWGESACKELENLMLEYDSLFMKHKADLGRCKILEHFIDLEPEAIPHREGARRMTPDKASKANEEIRHLLALGMIQPSYSPWASGIVMVKKKDGEMRFCCDFRPLNDSTIKDAYPLPRIDESLSRLGKTQCFTSIDLSSSRFSGRFQLRNKIDSRLLLACELGLFEWKRMPFGLCNVTAIFQSKMAKALRTVESREGSQVMCYIDDVIIATETVEDHLIRFREVFECLKKSRTQV